MYVNFLSTYSDKKSCHTSTTLQPATRGLSAIAELDAVTEIRRITVRYVTRLKLSLGDTHSTHFQLII